MTGVYDEALAADEEKVRENRFRRMADRQGLILKKSRRRDPRAIDFGMYALLDANTGAPLHAGDPTGRTIYSLDLDEVEEWLTG